MREINYTKLLTSPSDDEIRAFNAELNVIATDTMNELSAIRKQLAKSSVPFEEKSASPASFMPMNRCKTHSR